MPSVDLSFVVFYFLVRRIRIGEAMLKHCSNGAALLSPLRYRKHSPDASFKYSNRRSNAKALQQRRGVAFSASLSETSTGCFLHSSGANIGSQAGSMIGFWSIMARMLAGMYFSSSTTRNIYSLNQSLVIIRNP